eukprot:ANDGO_04597.mRNA.1 2-amino-3-carboxymuconate-6-semialdehyde decarboxylase
MGTRDPLFRIDVHAHLMPSHIPNWKEKFGYGGFMTLQHLPDRTVDMVYDDGQFFRKVERNCYDVQARIVEMDEKGVSVQVLSTIPVLFSYFAKPQDGLIVSQFLNDHLAECCRAHPDRFVGLGTVPLQDPALAVLELKRCVNELGLKGIQIASHVGGPGVIPKTLDDPSLFPVFQTAADLGCAVFIHPWYMDSACMKKYWTPWLVGMPAETALAACSLVFGGVLERLPTLRIGLAHGGGSFPFCLGRVQHGWEVRPDLCAVDNKHPPTKYVAQKHFFVDSLVHDPRSLEFLVSMFGSERVMLGTDYPFPLGEDVPGTLIEASKKLSSADKEQLLARTALDFLKLVPSDPAFKAHASLLKHNSSCSCCSHRLDPLPADE